MRLCCLLILLVFSASTKAYTPLFDGGFESGTLNGWVPGTHGTAIVTRRASCFSDHDTRHLSIRGQYAGLLRTPEYSSIEHTASLTSKPFVAGNGIFFVALSEQKDRLTYKQYALEISLLDQQGELLAKRPIVTALARLSPDCPGNAHDARFSQHFVSTQAYRGKKIKIRFSQHPDTAQAGGFTLIDQVSLFNPGETPALKNQPLAKASMGFDTQTQNLYLNAALPDRHIEQTRGWSYSWLINGEDTRRNYYKPCVNDLAPGNYTAILTVSNANSLSSDSLYFSVSKRDDKPGSPEANNRVCNLLHPLSRRDYALPSAASAR